MKSDSWQRWLHDGAAWWRERWGPSIPRVGCPDPRQGRSHVRVQDAGVERQDNRFAASLCPEEPVFTEWGWPDVDLWSFHKVHLVGTAGHIFLEGGKLWDPSARDARGRSGRVRPPIRWAQQIISGPCVHLCGMNHENRGHFVLEVLPRLEALLQFLPEASAYTYLVPAGQKHWQAQFLEFYGIRSEQLVEQGPGTTLVEELWVVPMLNGVDKLAHPRWHRAVARRLTREARPLRPDGTALFVSRRNAPNKKIENEEALIACMRKLCGEVHVTDLAGVTLPDQIELFRRAAVIVGGYGQGLTNTLFCERSRVIVLTSAPCFKRPSWVRAFQQLAQLSGNPAVCLLGSGKWIPNEDYKVDEQAFASLLARVLEAPDPPGGCK